MVIPTGFHRLLAQSGPAGAFGRASAGFTAIGR